MNYIDLALPSGTLWANENSNPCTLIGMPKKHVPTEEQFRELFTNCKTEKLDSPEGSSVLFTGKNGNCILLPLEGYLIPVYNFDKANDELDKEKEREFNKEDDGKGYYCTCDKKDWHRVICVMEDDNREFRASENSYKFSLRTVSCETQVLQVTKGSVSSTCEAG